MPKTITQSVNFPAKPKDLFKLYMDPAIHTEIGQVKVKVGVEPGSPFSVGRDLKGKTLHVKRDQIIVQTWRYTGWDKSVPDTVLILLFDEHNGGTKLRMVHANIPDDSFDEIKHGWNEYYWKPWRRYLKSMSRS